MARGYELSSEAEAAVIKQLIDDPLLLPRIEAHLRPEGFATDEAREVVRAIISYYREAKAAPTSVGVVEEIHRQGAAGRLPAERVARLREYFVDAIGGAALASDYVADRIASLDRGEALWKALHGGIKLHERGDFDGIVAEVRRAGEIGRAGGRGWPTPADRARRLGAAREKFSTGVGAIDAATRGGFRAGGLVVLGGPPGSCKTTLAKQLALRWARDGRPVLFLAADESADGVLIRVGQELEVADRDDLESGERDARERLALALEEIPTLALVDAGDGDHPVTVEDAADRLLADAGGAPAALVVDSIQRVRAREAEQADGERMRVDAVVRALKAAARRGLLVVATSEVGRAFYRAKDERERVDPLAAFRESSSIEFVADVALTLRSVRGGGGAIEAEIVKNRLAGHAALEFPARLALDRHTATLVEIDEPPPARVDRPDAGGRVAAAIELVRRELRLQLDRVGKRILRERLAKEARRKDIDEAIATLHEAGEIVDLSTNPKEPRWRLAKQEGGPDGVPSN